MMDVVLSEVYTRWIRRSLPQALAFAGATFMINDRKYQVFVSSTYADLRTEREKVQQALLAADCIPIGMEIFPPSDESQLAYIERTIEGCDFYILIIAGRYGSTDPRTGLSFTELEYRYADRMGIPTITFFHGSPEKLPNDLTEHNPRSQKKLEAFRTMALTKLARTYDDPNQLYGRVIHAVNELKKRYPDGGWVPAKHLPKADVLADISLLRSENEMLKRQLEEMKTGKPPIQAIDSQPNHVATRDLLRDYIRESVRLSDSIHVKIMAVSLHYSWDYFESALPILFHGIPVHKKISLELEMVAPEHLEKLGLEDWKQKGVNVQARIAAFVERESQPGGLVDAGRLELTLYQYFNVPHWHGTLINGAYLFMGRTRWVLHPESGLKILTVGEETYRLFSHTDSYGGPDRVAMFDCWFDYYRFSGRKVLSALRNE